MVHYIIAILCWENEKTPLKKKRRTKFCCRAILDRLFPWSDQLDAKEDIMQCNSSIRGVGAHPSTFLTCQLRLLVYTRYLLYAGARHEERGLKTTRRARTEQNHPANAKSQSRCRQTNKAERLALRRQHTHSACSCPAPAQQE